MMREFVATARAIAHPTRVRMLKLLEHGEMCVCDIQARIGGAQSTMSKHLGILHGAGLVAFRRRGLWVFYRIETEPIGDHNLRILSLVRASLNDAPEVSDDAAHAGTICREDQG